MKILEAGHLYYPTVGGVQMQMKGIAEHLVRMKENVTVFTANAKSGDYFKKRNGHLRPFKDKETINGVQVKRFPVRHTLYENIFKRFLKQKGGYRILNHFFKNAHETLRVGPFVPDMLFMVRKEKPDVLIAYSAYYATSYFCYLAKKRYGIPFVVIPSLRMEKGWHDDRMVDEIIKAADLVIAFTEYEKKLILDKGVDLSKIRIIGNAINPHTFAKGDGEAFRQKYHLTDDPVVLFLGRFARGKGVEHLIDALKEVWKEKERVQLVLAGQKQDMQDAINIRLEAMSSEQKRKVIVIDDFSPYERVNFYHGSDIFAMPSEIDSFGIVYLEAWASGKPVIACKDTAPSSYIEQGKDGLLVEYGNVNELTGAILDFLNDPVKCRTMGENGKKKVLQNYTWDTVAHSIKDELYKLIG